MSGHTVNGLAFDGVYQALASGIKLDCHQPYLYYHSHMTGSSNAAKLFGIVRDTLNQWLVQLGPSLSPTRKGLPPCSCPTASSKVGLVVPGADHTLIET